MLRRFIKWVNNKNEEVKFAESGNSESIVNLGRHAKSMLDNIAFDAACKRIEVEIFKAWVMSKPGQTDERERLYYRLAGLSDIKTKLFGMVQGMILGQKVQEQKQRQAEGSAQGDQRC